MYDIKGDLVKEMQQPGQFLHILVPRADLLLRRPISLNHIDHEINTGKQYGTKSDKQIYSGPFNVLSIPIIVIFDKFEATACINRIRYPTKDFEY